MCPYVRKKGQQKLAYKRDGAWLSGDASYGGGFSNIAPPFVFVLAAIFTDVT